MQDIYVWPLTTKPSLSADPLDYVHVYARNPTTSNTRVYMHRLVSIHKNCVYEMPHQCLDMLSALRMCAGVCVDVCGDMCINKCIGIHAQPCIQQTRALGGCTRPPMRLRTYPITCRSPSLCTCPHTLPYM